MEVERCIELGTRKFHLRRVRAISRCIKDAAYLPREGTDDYEPLDTSKVNWNCRALRELQDLDGLEVPITDELQLCPPGASFSRISSIMKAPSSCHQDFFVPWLRERDWAVKRMGKLTRHLNERVPEMLTERQEVVHAGVRKSPFYDVIAKYVEEEANLSEAESWDSRVRWYLSLLKIILLECVKKFGTSNLHVIQSSLLKFFNFDLSIKDMKKILARAVYDWEAWPG